MDAISINILDVGHGNCTVVNDDGGVVVVDTGPGSALLEFLMANNIDHIEVVLLSHADADHIAGLLNILTNDISVRQVRINTDSLKGSAIWDDLLAVLHDFDSEGRLDFDVRLVANSKESYTRGRVTVDILAPSKYLAARGPGSTDRQGSRITNNSISAVVRLSVDGDHQVLLAGDLDEVGLAEIEHNETDLSAKILVYPHHGGRALAHNEREFAERICEKVSPGLVVFSIGRGKYGTPRPEIVEAVKEQSGIYIACTQLSENCSDILPKARPAHLTQEFSSGNERHKCCSGTITIPLDDVDNMRPELKQHAEFVSSFVKSPLCR